MAGLFLGIDGGGTRCRARLRDAEARLMGEGEGGPANIHQDFVGSVASIRAATLAALTAAGSAAMPWSELKAGLGLAGIISAGSGHRLADAGLPFGALTVINDAHAACLGAHGGADGGIVIAGTGSAGYVIAGGAGRVIGGWGFELGDQGSGAIMGREAVRAAVLAIDGLGPNSQLTDHILDLLGRDQPTLTSWAKSARPSDYARFAPAVIGKASGGDAIAVAIAAAAAKDLAVLARRLLELGAPKLSMLGGMAAHFLTEMPPELRERFVPPMADAVDGAIIAARAAAGLPMGFAQ